MAKRKKKSVPAQENIVVLEYFGYDVIELEEQVHDAAGKALKAVYLTIPRFLDQTEVLGFLPDYFRELGPLNVGTNPRLKNNNVRERVGFLCLK